MPSLIIPALAVSLIGLVQGAGISKAYPNPDGSYLRELIGNIGVWMQTIQVTSDGHVYTGGFDKQIKN